MNRAERRRLEREARKNGPEVPVKNEDKVIKRYTQEEFGRLLYDTEFNARAHATEMMIVTYALAEHRLYGFGKTRAKRTFNYVESLMNDINTGKTTYEKLKQECAKELGIMFDF